MGLIKALSNAASTALGDQFKEFVNCPTIEKNVLIQRGIVNHGVGNTNPSEGIISNGSTIVVPQGMAMMIIDNGEIKEFTAEAGTFYFDTSSEPSIFTGDLGKSIIDTFKNIGKRFTYGGQTAKDQRVYYVNLLTIADNKFGSPQPKKITDEKYGMLEVTFFGEYAFRVVDPIQLVNSVIGANPKDTVTYEEVIGTQLQAKFVEQLTQAISVVMRKNKVSFGDIGLYNNDISEEMNNCLDESWRKLFGLEIVQVGLRDINLTEESMAKVNKIDEATIFSNQNLQSGLMASAAADAMRNAASNEGGAMMGFMGMNMAGQTAGTMMGAVNQGNTGQGLYNPQNQQPEAGTIFGAVQTPTPTPEAPVTESPVEETPAPEVPAEEVPTEEPAPVVEGEKECPNCHEKVTGKFCSNCGTQLE
ncbi:MAG: SPFH domain-containing protein [Bacilli bacterium]|nr:SPFH domain-containing protein [Bacilli bacterium]